ncbi:MAG TPA: hypothetical protein DD490_22320 [Acidobacteria bacterium]|nr:hypothetical protein [Acidobacteriota bacterium]
MASASGRPLSVFVSYSHRDKEWLDRLRVHLKPLERNGTIEVWADTGLETGQVWLDGIRRGLAEASAAVLLVSADFLASDFIAGEELPPLLEAAASRGVALLPLYLSPCRLASVPALARLQSVNPLDRPLIALSRPEQEAVFVRLAEAVEAALTSPAARLRAKIRRRFEEIEKLRRPSLNDLHRAEDRAFMGGMWQGLELADKGMFLLEELTALGSGDKALRSILLQEIVTNREQKARVNQELKAHNERELAKVRDLIANGPKS